jgi:hypothetical protein
MITIQDMLKLKEQELARLQKEIDALRLVASLYGESAMIDAARQSGEPIAPPSAAASAATYAPVIAVPAAAPPVTAYANSVPAGPAMPMHRNGGEKRFP